MKNVTLTFSFLIMKNFHSHQIQIRVSIKNKSGIKEKPRMFFIKTNQTQFNEYKTFRIDDQYNYSYLLLLNLYYLML